MSGQSNNNPLSSITSREVPDDNISLHSAAPSYSSSLPPAYTDRLPPSLPRAPEQPYNSLLTPPPPENYSVTAWPSLTGSCHQNRAYENVAERRTRRDAARMHANSLLARTNNVVRAETPRAIQDAPSPVSLAEEAKSWDFLTAQMADWELREKNWNDFRARLSKDQSRIPFPKKTIGIGGKFG
ncbi:hypothetical protein C7212DRAFT_328937 [Tuber magnatum]|uniref:Uncharacterized protein n=1 Tax=Tuber magnatum TaxID=42249 RepID=A0A317SIU4_9PEZI|nr:hypothetical protein C7212DRAFT_328937 [Tuber magnatum]